MQPHILWVDAVGGFAPSCSLTHPPPPPIRPSPAITSGEVIVDTVWRRREVACEFCDRQLPDWKKTLTPVYGASAPAVMNVNFDGRTYSFEVQACSLTPLETSVARF